MPFHGGLDLEQTRMTMRDRRKVFAKAVDVMTDYSISACRRRSATPGCRPVRATSGYPSGVLRLVWVMNDWS